MRVMDLEHSSTISTSTIHLSYSTYYTIILLLTTLSKMGLRLRLFDDVTDSPVRCETTNWDTEELAGVITPYSKYTTVKEDELSIELPSHKKSVSRLSKLKKNLFQLTPKRTADDLDDQPSPKRARCDVNENTTSDVIDAVDKLTTEIDLIADGSRDYTLPTIPGKHSDLKSFSPETLVNVLKGDYSDRLGHVTIVDCRYPYEYEGGHIKGAVNLYTKDDVYSLLQKSTTTTTDKPRVLVFHCEFSSERGPKMYRFLRAQDRELNKHNYPKLNFPEIYLLDGGYKAFYYADHVTSELCQPMNYKPMLHEDHNEDLRHFRKKSKSWTAAETQKPRARFSRRKTLNF